MHNEHLYMIEDALENVTITGNFSGIVAIASYVFCALALYTIAQRRGIRKAWMAWIPVLNGWILGSISDQYRYVVKGEVRNKRKALLTVSILRTLFTCAATVNMIVLVVKAVTGAFNYASEAEMIRQILSMLAFFAPVMILGLVGLVLDAIALFDLYTSCEPANNVLYLVLSLIPAISSITRPLFLFLCRDKDGGMPPRRQNPEAYQEPVDYQYDQM